LSKVPAHLVDAFLECELEGSSRDAICRDMNVTPENLSVRLFRARLLLRGCLEMNWFCGGEARREAGDRLSGLFLPPDARERVKAAFLAAYDRGGPVNSRAPTD
jgi:hypothetical protein